MSDSHQELVSLSEAQRATAEGCIELGAAWVTSAGSDNDEMLKGWCDLGWVTPAAPPSGTEDLLTAYLFTEAGAKAIRGEL